MKSLFNTFLLFIFFSTFVNANQYLEFTTENFTKIVADEISKTLPKRLNTTTMLTMVKSEKNELNFTGELSEVEYEKENPNINLNNYTKEEKDTLKKEIISQLQSSQENELCSSMTTRTVLESGVKFKYEYFFKASNSFIGETNISLDNCLKK